VGDRVASVQLQDFLHHPDIPHFDDSVRVSAGDQVARDAEVSVVN
jgi:hypothetical protein